MVPRAAGVKINNLNLNLLPKTYNLGGLGRVRVLSPVFRDKSNNQSRSPANIDGDASALFSKVVVQMT